MSWLEEEFTASGSDDVNSDDVNSDDVNDGGAGPDGDEPGAPDANDVVGGSGGVFGDDGFDTETLPAVYSDWTPVATDTISGDPSDDAVFWLYQGAGTGTCGPTSVAMILSDIVDTPIGTNQEVVDRALDLGLITYDPSNPAYAGWGGWSGMSSNGVEQLFESFGVGATQYTGTVNDLGDMLEAGQSIVVAVDSTELEFGVDNDDTNHKSNHFVEVTGVDLTNGIVYVNDPAITNGAGFAVSLSVFADSWEDSGSLMIVTDTTTEADEQATVAPVAAEQPAYDQQVYDTSQGIDPSVAPLSFDTTSDGVVYDWDDALVNPDAWTILPFTFEYEAGVWLEPPAC